MRAMFEALGIAIFSLVSILAGLLGRHLGVLAGRRSLITEHVHDWAMWMVVEDHQERFCHGCGLIESTKEENKAQCPPHDWGKWSKNESSGSYWDDKTHTRRSCQLQERFCDRCGIKDLKRVTSRGET